MSQRVPKVEYSYFTYLSLDDFCALRPADEELTREQQQYDFEEMKRRLDRGRFLGQSFGVDEQKEEYVSLSESYRPPKTGFPGRLTGDGLQCLWRPIRTNLLKETADLDMNNAMPRCLLWVCNTFSIKAKFLQEYVDKRDGEGGILERLQDELGVSKASAKDLVSSVWTSNKPVAKRDDSSWLRRYDNEAKEAQKRLMAQPELEWIHRYTNKTKGNEAGSFVSLLYQFIECRMLLAVFKMLKKEYRTDVTALIFDGLNVADASFFGREDVLTRATAVCETVWPGVNMVWKWKEPDFMIRTKATQSDVKELRVPDGWREAWERWPQENPGSEDEEEEEEEGPAAAAVGPATIQKHLEVALKHVVDTAVTGGAAVGERHTRHAQPIGAVADTEEGDGHRRQRH